ncbi:hypothetical protein Tco_0771587 [Tanacetum coccineum]|uniref:Ubiquitin-like protease family profile domain-containing protein n=1 Tax=Tanacetum coccineum TaxID=301880 RepID=A0ABQ4ZI26_9ASTR
MTSCQLLQGYGVYITWKSHYLSVYYVEVLVHNSFSVGQFCDGDLEVAFRSNTCYVRNLEGDDLLTGGRDSNLYTISISDMAASSPICLMSKATSTKSCPMFEDYFEQKSSDTTINSAAQLTPIQKLLHFYSSIYFDELTSRKILADFDGCKQEEGIDFEESFALLLVLRLSGVHDFGCSYEYHYLSNECHKTAFLNGPFCEKKGRSMRTMRFKDDYKSTSGGLQFLGGKARELSLRVPLYSFNPVNILRQSHWTSGIILLRNSLSGVLWKFSLSEHYTNLADLFTNALPKERFEYLVHRIVIIIAQQPHAADVHPDELLSPNKQYDLMDANKETVLHFKIHGLLQPWQTLCKIFSKVNVGRHLLFASFIRVHFDPYTTIYEEIIIQKQKKKNQEDQGWDALDTSMHLAAEEIEKLVEESENVDDSSPPRHDDTFIPGTRLEPRSDKESPEVEIVQEKEEETTKDTEVEPDKDIPMVDVTNIVIPVNVDDEEDEITDEVFELRRRAKGKNVEETRISPNPSPTRSPRNLSTLVSSDTEKLQELMVTHPTPSAGSSAPNLHDEIRPDDPHDDASPEGENVQKGRRTSKYKDMYLKRSSSGQVNVEEQTRQFLSLPSTNDYTIISSCQRDPKAPALSLINQDLLYLKKGNSGPEKIVLSLHKFPAIVFNDDDIEERTSRWVNKCIKKFNPYARYGVENWKNPHAERSFYIRRPEEPEIVARRANDCIVSITESDYKNLNKNDIEDMYLLIVNNKVPDYANTGLLWSLSVFIRSSVIWERVHDFQLGIESYQQKINSHCTTKLHSEEIYAMMLKDLTNDDVEFLMSFGEVEMKFD